MGISSNVSATILQFRPRKKGIVVMNNEEEKKTTTSITLTTEVVELVKQDAHRCRRSMASQIQAILDTIYLGRDVAIHGTENYTPSIELDHLRRKKAG